ncbi:hypothetical protein ACSSS7_001774 [Eimeria intestinalis]
MEKPPQERGENEGGAPTALGPSDLACPSPPAEGEGPLDAAVSAGGRFDKVPGAAPAYRSADELPGAPLSEGAPPGPPLSRRPYGRVPAGKFPSLLHFDAGSLMLTGVSVGLALYDWALQMLKGAPGLLQPGASLPANSGKPRLRPPKACARCSLLGRVGPSSPVFSTCSAKACGALFRRRGPRRRRQVSAGSYLYEPWGSPPLGEEAGALGPPATSAHSVPSHGTLQPEGPCEGAPSSPPCGLGGSASGAPEEGGPPVQTAQGAARVATSAVRRSLKYFASRASAAGREFEGCAAASASLSPVLRLTEGVLLLGPTEQLGGPPRRDKAAEGFSRGSGRSRGAAVATAVAAAAAAATTIGAAAAAGPHGRGVRAAGNLTSSVTMGAPQGPPYPARMRPRGFRGDSKTAAARLRLRMRASGRGPLAEALRCSRSAGAICSEGSHRGPRRSCCEEGLLDSELGAFAIQGAPSRVPQPSRWEGLEDAQGALYGSTETGDSCGACEEGPLAGSRASSFARTACLTRGCNHAAARVEQQAQQPLWHQRLPGASAVRRPELEWALDCITSVATELSMTKDSSRRSPLLHAAGAHHAQELIIAGEGSPRRAPLSAGARCTPTWIEEEEECCCTESPDEPPDVKDVNTFRGPPLSWGPPSPSGMPPQEAVRLEGPPGLTEVQGASQPLKSLRSSCPQSVPASAGAPQGSGRGSPAGLGGPLFSSRAYIGSPQLPRGPRPGLEGPTVTRVTPTAKPMRPRKRRDGASKNAPSQTASGGPFDR